MFAVLLLALGIPEHRAAPATAEPYKNVAITPSRLALAEKIVDVVLPDQSTLHVNIRGWEVGLRAALLNNPGVATVESKFPGAINRALDAGRPIARPYLWSQIRKAKAIKVAITADMLDEAEMQVVMDFYLSPAGQRFIQSLSAKSDPNDIVDGLIERVNDTGQVTMTGEDVQKSMRGTLRETLKVLSAEEIAEIMKFEAKPAAKKMAEAGRKADAAILEIFNTPDPVFMEAQNKAVTEAILAHIEKHQAATK